MSAFASGFSIISAREAIQSEGKFILFIGQSSLSKASRLEFMN